VPIIRKSGRKKQSPTRWTLLRKYQELAVAIAILAATVWLADAQTGLTVFAGTLWFLKRRN
jgi:hypothetical protein